MGTAKQACKKASLKIAKIGEAHHGLAIEIGNIVDRHDKLLSAAVVRSKFSCKTLYHFEILKSITKVYKCQNKFLTYFRKYTKARSAQTEGYAVFGFDTDSFLLTLLIKNGKINRKKRDDETQYAPHPSVRELPSGARQQRERAEFFSERLC